MLKLSSFLFGFYLIKFHSLESKHGRMLVMILALLQRIMLKREATYPTFKWFRTKLIEGSVKLMSLLPSPADHLLLIPSGSMLVN